MVDTDDKPGASVVCPDCGRPRVATWRDVTSGWLTCYAHLHGASVGVFQCRETELLMRRTEVEALRARVAKLESRGRDPIGKRFERPVEMLRSFIAAYGPSGGVDTRGANSALSELEKRIGGERG